MQKTLAILHQPGLPVSNRVNAAYNLHTQGVLKLGGILGYVGIYPDLDMKNCIVDGMVLSNYKPGIEDPFEAGSGSLKVSVTFTTEGECGGLIGFIGGDAIINNCVTQNCNIKCYGQDEKKATIKLGPISVGKLTIPGRYVNEYIGTIRTQESPAKTVTITNASTKDNTYGNGYSKHKHSNDVSLVGCCYYIAATVGSYGAMVIDQKGTVKVNGIDVVLDSCPYSLW